HPRARRGRPPHHRLDVANRHGRSRRRDKVTAMTAHPSPMSRKATALLGALIAAAAAATAAPAGATPDLTKVPVRYDLTGTGVAGYITYQTQNGQAHATNA